MNLTTVDEINRNFCMKISTLILLLPYFFAVMGAASCGETEKIYADTQNYEPPAPPVELLALGDSYTIGQSVAEADRWPNLLAHQLQAAGLAVKRTEIIARTGWRTDNLATAIETQKPDSNFNLVGLLIGVNNQYQGHPLQEYETQFTELLQTAIALFAGLALAFLLEYLNDRLRDADTAGEALGLPVLGQIPLAAGRKRGVV